MPKLDVMLRVLDGRVWCVELWESLITRKRGRGEEGKRGGVRV